MANQKERYSMKGKGNEMKITEKQLDEMLKDDFETIPKANDILSDEVKKLFENSKLYSQDGMKEKAKVKARFFNPYGTGTWLALEGQQENEYFTCFGMVNLGSGFEYGYFTLNELFEAKKGDLHLIERDLHFDECTLEEALKNESEEDWKEYESKYLKEDEEN